MLKNKSARKFIYLLLALSFFSSSYIQAEGSLPAEGSLSYRGEC